MIARWYELYKKVDEYKNFADTKWQRLIIDVLLFLLQEIGTFKEKAGLE